MSAM
jgi:hypothetical protein